MYGFYDIKDKLKKVYFLAYLKNSLRQRNRLYFSTNLALGIEKVIHNQYFELRIGYLSETVTGKLILEKIP